MRLIDADALKYNIEHAKALYLDEELVFKIIDQAPRVVRMKGKWVKRFYFRESSNCYDLEMKVCSECRDECSWDAETGVSKYNFCPNCGADMRGDTNDDNYC